MKTSGNYKSGSRALPLPCYCHIKNNWIAPSRLISSFFLGSAIARSFLLSLLSHCYIVLLSISISRRTFVLDLRKIKEKETISNTLLKKLHMTQVSRAHVRFSKTADYFCNIYQHRDNHVDELDYSYLRLRSFSAFLVNHPARRALTFDWSAVSFTWENGVSCALHKNYDWTLKKILIGNHQKYFTDQSIWLCSVSDL